MIPRSRSLPALAALLLGTAPALWAAPPEFQAPPPPELDKGEAAPGPAQPGKAAPEPPAEQQKQAAEQEQLQPQVTIIKRKHATIEEYRIGGRLRYVKIIPAKGPPYYLFDTDGDGILETRSNTLNTPPNVNQWILFRW